MTPLIIILDNQIEANLSHYTNGAPARPETKDHSLHQAKSLYTKRRPIMNDGSMLYQVAHTESILDNSASRSKKVQRFNSVYDYSGAGKAHGNPEQNDLSNINEDEELHGEGDVSLFHEALVKTLDAQVKQVFNILHAALNRGSVNPHGSNNRVINRMT